MKPTFAAVSLTLLLALAGCFHEKNQPPTARILAPENNLRTNALTLTFRAELADPEGELVSTLWNFGDGTQEPGGAEATHTYAQGGDYTVRVTVSDAAEQTATAAVRVSINQPPSAAARAQLTLGDEVLPFVKVAKGVAPLEVQFQGDASRDPDGELASLRWDFGDGATSEEANPVHRYEAPGRYEAVLTVTDGEGLSAQDRVQVTVEPKALTLTDYLETDVIPPATTLIRGATISGTEALKSVLYSYEMAERRAYSEAEIRLALLSTALGLAVNPEIGRLTIYLFSEKKEGFMEPVDFAHYLGMAEWERPEGQPQGADLANHVIANTQLHYNTKYLNGTAPTVVGYRLNLAELEADDPRCTICPEQRVFYVSLMLNPTPEDGAPASGGAPLCRQHADATVQAVIQRALLAPGAYGINVYDGTVDVANQIAVAIWGSRVDIAQVPTDSGLLFEGIALDSGDWDIDGTDFKLHYAAALPDCGG